MYPVALANTRMSKKIMPKNLPNRCTLPQTSTILYDSMIRENRQLVTDEPVLILRNNRLKFKTAGKLQIILEEFIEYTPI